MEKKTEVFDIEYFNSNKKWTSLTLENEDNHEIQYSDRGESFFVVNIYPKDSPFYTYKEFDSNGILETKGTSFIGGNSVGVKYLYDKEGTLIKEENTDEGYDFGPEDILAYCEENDIELPKGYPGRAPGFIPSVRKAKRDGKKVWIIEYYNFSQPDNDLIDYEIAITLDGKTGEEIKREKHTVYLE